MILPLVISVRHGDTLVAIRIGAETSGSLHELAAMFEETCTGDAPGEIELYARFLEFCTTRCTEAALAVLAAFDREFCAGGRKIHAIVSEHGLDEDSARTVLRAYYSLWGIDGAHNIYRPTTSALFSDPSVHLMAIFGGQRGTGNCLDEARWLLDVYNPLLRDFVTHMSDFLLRESKDARVALAYYQGLDVFRWLTESESEPGASYLRLIPVCLPVTGLTQLMQIMVLFKTQFMSPGDLAQTFKIVAGHSQGIAIATALSMLSDEEAFYSLSEKVLGIQMLTGALPQLEFPYYTLGPRLGPGDAGSNTQTPYPMAAVRGISKQMLEQHIAAFNSGYPRSEHVFLAVTNTSKGFIVAGTTVAASRFATYLQAQSASPDLDQSRIPFNKRSPVIGVTFLEITAPYHCPLLKRIIGGLCGIAQEKDWVLDAGDMRIPVRACDDGHDIRTEANLTKYLFESMCVLPVNWPTTVSAPDITHIVDFGPGGFSGFGQLTRAIVEGQGVPVICAGALVRHPIHGALGTKGDLYKNRLDDIISAPNWLDQFGPRLVRTAHDGKVHIDTRMQNILGAPTVMVAGMTPTTANCKFVAAINNAGYHAELAGGGMYSEADMEDKIKELAESVKPGQGITLNCVYLSQKQWSFQFPALLRLRSEGLPIAGLCIGGGVPSFDVALEIINSLREAGFRHVAFKPSTAEAIRHVIRVAQASDGFPIVLQWTGGRAGGHHSYEDFHQPILETYAAIRACDNVALVAGSGFGDATGTLPYLTGDWSIEYGRAPMPFDGILLASRVMVAKEAGTSLAAKQLIVAAQGLPDPDWHQTYGGTDGGVTSFTTEFGELNHVLDTRATILLRDMHATILNQSRDKREALLRARKDEIISRLNADYMRPWFGQKADGRVVDLEDMTYAEVIDRLVELMYVKHQRRWIHPSYTSLITDFINRTESRMAMVYPDVPITTYLGEDPCVFAKEIAQVYPQVAVDLLTPEDIQFFIHMCKRRGQKPVPFIPVLDADFGTLLQKDSIWQSEDLDAVVDQDPQRVCIQQGAVAARYSTVVDEPVKNILDGIYQQHIKALMDHLYDGDESSIPTVEYIGNDPAAVSLPAAVQVCTPDTERVFHLPEDSELLPELDTWLQAVAGPQKSWLQMLLTTPTVVRGSQYSDNFVRRLMRPRPGRTVTVHFAQGQAGSLDIVDKAQFTELRIERTGKQGIDVLVVQPTHRGPVTLRRCFTYCPSTPLTPIYQSPENDAADVRRFYRQTCVDVYNDAEPLEDVTDLCQPLPFTGLTVTEHSIRTFCQTVGNWSWRYATKDDGLLRAPLEFVYLSVSLTALRVLSSPAFGEGQLGIVHQANHIELADGVPLLYVGDQIRGTMYVSALVNTASGKQITLESEVFVGCQLVARVTSTFLAVGFYVDVAQTFRRVRGRRICIKLPTAAEVVALETKEWFIYRENALARLEPGVSIEFCLDSDYTYQTSKVLSRATTTGTVTLRPASGKPVLIADVDFQWSSLLTDVVIEYLQHYEHTADTCMFDNGGYRLPLDNDATTAVAPDSNHAYACVSGDGNPIHTNVYVADMAHLPTSITHGQWTSASTRAILEHCLTDENPERIRAFSTEFIGMVRPGDTLSTEIFHVGMKRGRMLVEGSTYRAGNEPVLKFTAEVEQPLTAYVFTGLGQQHADMGMALYQSSAAARAVWDQADRHMLRTYGLPLLKIVRHNPIKHTIYFEGEVGEKIRANYLALKARFLECTDATELSAAHPLSSVNNDSWRLELSAPEGLLNMTQIAQLALAAFALAASADLGSRNLLQMGAVFAGHSLGEVCALAALGDMFSVEDALDVAFCRGMVLQSAATRDAQGRSQYAMAAVNPSRVGTGFDEKTLQMVIDRICATSPGLLQVVNYNVRKEQYVVAGTLTNLAVLRMVLDRIAGAGSAADADVAGLVGTEVCAVLETPVDPTPARGLATIPLQGIEVPSHSTELADKLFQFRAVLCSKITPETISLDALCGRYIPNVTAVPFAVSKEYFELAYSFTKSPVLAAAIDSWNDTALERHDEKAHLASLLLVELLAYQLSLPVQWIKIQDQLFERIGVRRVVEIGPAAVLCGLAAKTLSNSAQAKQSVVLLHMDRDRDSVYYNYVDGEASKADNEVFVATSASDPSKAQPKEIPQPVSAPPTHDLHSAGASAPIVDVPLPAVEVIHAIVAFRMKQSRGEVSTQQTVKVLADGKSILQNEIVGDLQKEYGNRVPDKAEELSLQELGTAIGTSEGLGKCTQPLVARIISSKLPGGFSLSRVRDMLQSTYGLGPQRQNGLLLVALTMEPKARLGSEAEASGWLDTVAQAYAANSGISYLQMAESAISSAQGQGPVVSSAELEKMQQRQFDHVKRQIEVLARYAGIDLRQDGRLAETQQTRSAELQTKLDAIHTELGEDFAESIMPCFDARKARHFDSYWNWARQDAYQWIQQTIADASAGSIVDEDRVHRLLSRADPELVQMLSGMTKVFGADSNGAVKPALELTSRLVELCTGAVDKAPLYRELSTPSQPRVQFSSNGSMSYSEVARVDEPTFAEYIKNMQCVGPDGAPPPLHLRHREGGGQWEYEQAISAIYYDSLQDICSCGLSFSGKTALVTGCGRGSIGADIVRGLLMGGAKVIATTSSYSHQTALFYEDMYRQYGARGSELIVVPFNQGSIQDVDALVSYIFGQGWDLDYAFPFAAVPDVARVDTGLGPRSELAQRVMLTNFMRLLGRVMQSKKSTGSIGRPALVVLPLSPNHGTFGGDGLYGESKAGLETALNRWKSESWGGYLSIVGAVIGWTRGTSMMSANNPIAQEIEARGMRTFSTREMALNLLALLNPCIARIAHRQPVWADFNGGAASRVDFGSVAVQVRDSIVKMSAALQQMNKDGLREFASLQPDIGKLLSQEVRALPLAKHHFHFPPPRSYADLGHLGHLQDMVNLDKVVVITGYGEVGPYGNAETRWEMEAFAELSTEGCIELAWIMGLIRHHNGQLPAIGKSYVGWVDVESDEPVPDADIKPRYEEYILAHTGIRIIEPEMCNGYNPSKKDMLREIQIQHDMEPFSASAEDAAAYKKTNGDQVDTWENSDSSWSVRFLKGALIRVPAFVDSTRLVAGQLPTGWNARRYGITEDIIKQVDPVVLYALVAVAEALIRSGFADPYELYQYFHVSEVGNALGSGMGGGRSLQDVFCRRHLDEDVMADVVQESFVSTVQAWINMLLVSGSGPVRPAVGACATAIVSVDTAVDAIQSGKAKVMIAGGVEDLFGESSTEFASMGATSNTVDEFAQGRTPSEMCRPCTSSRSGFMEGQGAGAVVLMSAAAAIKCGAPIYGVVGMSSTATDKEGRSVPAPGKGVLTSARELKGPEIPQRLDIHYRRRKLESQVRQLDMWKQTEEKEIQTNGLSNNQVAQQLVGINKMYWCQRHALQDMWGNEFWKQDTEISPLRGSLAVWGLTIDDIGLASFHATATKANDQNESELLNAQLQHLGRTPGHVLPAVCQKWLTGHPKGAAAAWMLNGVLQSLRTSIIPGNRNADNICSELKQCDYSLYLSQTIQTPGIKAALLKSFGFGQVGGELLVIHPDYILAALDSQQLATYNQMLEQRGGKSHRHWQDIFVDKQPFVRIKTKAPYTDRQEQGVYLNPQARAHYDPATGEYVF